MTDYILDTNILLRASDSNSNQYSLAKNAVYHLLSRNNQCFLTTQILIEFWVVSTRPIEVNGFGWNSERTEKQVNQLISEFTVLSETPDTLSHWLKIVTNYWLKIVTNYKITGKRTHDMRILALMRTYEIHYILTFNPKDFMGISDFIAVHPQAVITD